MSENTDRSWDIFQGPTKGCAARESAVTEGSAGKDKGTVYSKVARSGCARRETIKDAASGEKIRLSTERKRRATPGKGKRPFVR